MLFGSHLWLIGDVTYSVRKKSQNNGGNRYGRKLYWRAVSHLFMLGAYPLHVSEYDNSQYQDTVPKQYGNES